MEQFTEQFIRMAEKGEEVQKDRWSRGLKAGDHVTPQKQSLPIRVRIISGEADCTLEAKYHYTQDYIWLPLPHQSLEMVEKFKMFGPKGVIAALHYHLERPSKTPAGLDDYWFDFSSMAELCLAFLYHVQYGKRWTGQDWVKEKMT